MNRILIAEDEVEFCILYRSQLQRAAKKAGGTLGKTGYEIQEVHSLDLVLPEIQLFKPDVLILDLTFPGGSDANNTHKFFVQHRDTLPATLVLTGHPDTEMRIRFLESGASDYMSKETLNIDPMALAERCFNAFHRPRYASPKA